MATVPRPEDGAHDRTEDSKASDQASIGKSRRRQLYDSLFSPIRVPAQRERRD